MTMAQAAILGHFFTAGPHNPLSLQAMKWKYVLSNRLYHSLYRRCNHLALLLTYNKLTVP